MKCQVNWISQIYTFKKGFSREWVKILTEENSISSTVNITKYKVVWNDKYTDINIFTNKLFYNSMIKAKATHPIGFNNWSRHLNVDEKLICHKYIRLFFNFLQENKLKIFRWKIDSVYYSNQKIINCLETLKL